MVYLAVAETAVLIVISFLVVGLLRSHAIILRDVAMLKSGESTSDSPREVSVEERGRAPLPAAPPSPEALDVVLDAIDGFSLELQPSRWDVGASGRPTLVAFLSSGCLVCADFWRDLSLRGDELGEVDIVVVTKDREEENLAKLRSLAARDLRTIMASSAWERLGIPGSPYFVLLSPDGHKIVGAGSARDWTQMSSLISDYLDEMTLLTDELQGDGLTRVERENRLLASAGVEPDDPSLYAPPEPSDLQLGPAAGT